MTLKIITRLFVAVLLSASVIACSPNRSVSIGQGFSFAFIDTRDYTNVYLNELAVIPGGCDSVQWNDTHIVAKGNHQRYVSTNVTGKPAFDYFIIDKAQYKGDDRQEQSSGFSGPFTLTEAKQKMPWLKNQFIGL